MSQVKVTLQPPPNVDFVTGYPGIPPGPDRPQASVKGAVEVRVPVQGVKAKWVRIELRKVETLTGGGPSNTFYDFVGPSPVNLWSTSDEYTILRSQDFPFSIRIPESIPPSVALDNKAGIAYELVASVCTKGKRGFLRKAKSVVASAIAPITIDKHELHATWPVYCQPEQRSIAQDGVTLIVDRKNTCYGPGDRVSVTATVKSDSLHTVILRGYEFFLKETTVFSHGVHATGRKNAAPSTKTVNIAESKSAVNATLYGGTQNTTELSFMISGSHTTTTLNAARHIDVTYTLCIRALMGTGTHIVLDLPVIVSNWQRHVSYDAITRIGPAPGLSLLPINQVNQPLVSRIERPSEMVAATLPLNRPTGDFTANINNSLPLATATRPSVDDFGYGSAFPSNRAGVDDFGAPARPVLSINPNSSVTSGVSSSSTAIRNNSSNAALRIKNEVVREPMSRNPSAQATGSGPPGSSSGQNAWPSAEEEKRRYEQARNEVVKVHGPESAPLPLSLRGSSPPPAATSSPPRAAASSTSNTQWISAEEEKRRLFEKAQGAVLAKQGQTSPPPQEFRQEYKPPAMNSKPTGAELYQSAKPRGGGGGGGGSSSNGQAGGSSNASGARHVPQYQTAEQEKAALRRYEDAKRAVEMTHNDDIPSFNPVSYDSLYPANRPVAGGSSSQPIRDDPPSFEAPAVGNDIITHLSEKERLRQAYAASDALAARSAPPAAYTAPPSAPAPTPSPAPAHSVSQEYASAQEEKDAVRRKLEARDAARAKQAPQAPARAHSATPANPASPGRSPNNSSFRPTPQPPARGNSGGASRVLTAAEEKALLQARFAARDGGEKPPHIPPPLMPRPPVEYIKETQDEDARLSRFNNELVPNLDKVNGSGTSAASSGNAPGLDMKPFTPFRSAFDTPSSNPGPPPPLPKSD